MITGRGATAGRGLSSSLDQLRELALLGFIAVLVVVISVRSPSFLSLGNFRDILLDISILAIVALAQAIIIITRGIDLSVASMLALVAMMVSFVIRAYPETPIILTVLLGMGLGMVLGSFNGIIITAGASQPAPPRL